MPYGGKGSLRSAVALAVVAAVSSVWAEATAPPTYESLLEQVHAAQCTPKDEANSLRFDCSAEHKIYFFSRAGTPMHPGVVIRSIISDETGISIRSVGYSFDDSTRIAFQSWLDGFQKQDQQIEEVLKKKQAAAKH